MEQAIAKSVAKLPGTGGADADGGGTCVRKDGQIGWAHNSEMFAVGYRVSGMDQGKAYLKKAEQDSGVSSCFP